MIGKGITVYLFCENLREDTMKTEIKKNVTDSRLFWKSVKPLLSDKSRIRNRNNISEKGEILKTESETAETLNSFFSNIVKNLNISRHSEFDPFTENSRSNS